ncbi:hypothetical protein BHM03_00030108 [Ensete ventricosum]|nr:hypothetical protein BHM03_00030108 [Ensete ventricosum]
MVLLQARLPSPWLAVALCSKYRERQQGYVTEDWLAGIYQKEEGSLPSEAKCLRTWACNRLQLRKAVMLGPTVLPARLLPFMVVMLCSDCGGTEECVNKGLDDSHIQRKMEGNKPRKGTMEESNCSRRTTSHSEHCYSCGNRGIIYFAGDLFPTPATSPVSGSANAPATLAPAVTSPANTPINAVPVTAPGPATAQGPAASC